MSMKRSGKKGLRTFWAAFAAAVAVAAAGTARAEVKAFPACPWRETKVVRDAKGLRVVDAAGRGVLQFRAEGGDYVRHVVVSQAVDHLVIDARAAFKAGMRKLIISSSGFDPKPYRGQDCTLVTEVSGVRGTKCGAFFEGNAPGLHYYRKRSFETSGIRRQYALAAPVAAEVDSLHLRWDIDRASGPVAFYGARYALESELPSCAEKKKVVPELLFHAPFDGTPDAAFAKGAKAPLRASGLEYAEGRVGKAVRLTARAKSDLAYAAKDNLVPERGTVTFWFKREWPDRGRDAKGAIWRTLFANERAKGAEKGSGRLWFWWWGDSLRADQGDAEDQYTMRRVPAATADDWNLVAMTWDEERVRIYVNDEERLGDSASPMREALKPRDLLTFTRQAFSTFSVGGEGGGRACDGLVDDLRIYSAPLTPGQVRALWRQAQEVALTLRGRYAEEGTPATLSVSATSPRGLDLSAFRYCLYDAAGKVARRFDGAAVGPKAAALPLAGLPAGDYALRVTDGTRRFGAEPVRMLKAGNPYELTGAAAKAALKAPGVLADGALELVETLTLDRKPGEKCFRAVGPVAAKSLGATPYLEAGPNAGDRFALRFDLGADAGKGAPLYVFEIDYPDDAVRTADLIVQRAGAAHDDYTMQVGLATGDEYPNTGKVLTHRVLYWAGERDVALVAMTARKGAPAAVAAVRVYRVKGGALPAEEMREPKPAPGAGNRVAALYFEDPAIGYDFAVPSTGSLPRDVETLIDRTAALMKFTGENLFAYPGAWYHGLIGDDYQPRRHAPDYLEAWYAKFDREGLSLMPTVNMNTMPLPDGLDVTRRTMGDGSLHGSVIAIHDTGKPNWGQWHDTPPNFNFHHPDVRRHIDEVVDALVEQGAGHSSFKGVCLHLSRHCYLWFGDEASGYNDYTVEAFAKAKGLTLPAGLKKGPLRGKAYAAWLRANAWDDWLQWRCDVVTDFYSAMAKRLAARRPDLKLWLNYWIPADLQHPDVLKDEYMSVAWRGAGLDPVRLTREIPNLVLGQTMLPADYRWRGSYPTPDVRARQRTLDETAGFYANLKGAAFPIVHQHDRYWESPIGATAGAGNTLTCDWLKECRWRVSTINPSGRNALRHFVEPLRFVDVLGVSKGGFLIGTYGMEGELVPFLQAFRALPAVVMQDVAAVGDVRVRQGAFDGQSYFYVVNTGLKPARVTLDFPPKTRNLVTGEVFTGKFFGLKGETRTLDLAPYELRSFAAPKGGPRVAESEGGRDRASR